MTGKITFIGRKNMGVICPDVVGFFVAALCTKSTIYMLLNYFCFSFKH